MAAPLPNLTLHEGTFKTEIDPVAISDAWLAAIESKIKSKGLDDEADQLFHDDCWWRDILALSWDWTTKHGKKDIVELLRGSPQRLYNLQSIKSGALAPSFVDMGQIQWVQAGFAWESDVGCGRGLVRFANVGPNEWRAWTVYSVLEQLKGPTNGASTNDPVQSDEFQVLVIGAGKSYMQFTLHLHADQCHFEYQGNPDSPWEHTLTAWG